MKHRPMATSASFHSPWTGRLLSALLLTAVAGALAPSVAPAAPYTPVVQYQGGLDPLPYIYTNTVTTNGIDIFWTGFQGPYQVQLSTNLGATWMNVGSVTNTLLRNSLSIRLPTNTPSGRFQVAAPTPHYNGTLECGYCHDQLAADWSQTPHASAFDLLTSTGNQTNTACLPCHTVGYSMPPTTTTRSFSVTNGLGLITNIVTNIVYNGFISTNATPNLTDVRCENCHGPAGGHAGSYNTPAVTLSSMMCGGCHDGGDPENHSIFKDWETAGHAEVLEDIVLSLTNSALATSQSEMGRCGACHSGAVRLALLKSSGSFPSGQEASEIAQTCVTCHDPHDKHVKNGGFHLRNPMFSTNFFSFATSQTGAPAYGDSAATNYSIAYSNFWKQYNPDVQICGQCHNARGAAYTSNSRPPHHSPQYNILLGNIGVTTNATPPQSPHATACSNQCAECHMNVSSLPGHTNAAEHSFSPNTNACVNCHEGTDPQALIDDVQADITARINNVVGLLRVWGETKSPTNTTPNIRATWGTNAWEYTINGTLSSGVGPTNSTLQGKLPTNIQKARWNLYLVYHDQSLGVHNAKYSRYLLDVASNLVITAP